MIIFCSLSAIFMAGCTADVVNYQPSVSEQNFDAWKYDESLPVPIILRAQEMETKASYPINKLADMADQMFGIFAINKKNPELEVLIENNVAQYRHRPNGTSEFMFGTQTGHVPERYYLYYPLDSDKNYTFVAYCCKHSYKTNDEKKTEVVLPGYTIKDKRILVDVEVARSEDVLWGKAEAEGEGYNAQYLRKNLDSPHLKFTHPTAGLAFTTSLAEGVTLNRQKDSIRVTSVILMGVPKKSRLCVYDCDKENSLEGTFVEDVGNPGNAALLTPGGSNASAPVRTDRTSIGNAIFIKPQSEPVKCRVRLTHFSYYNNNGTWMWVVSAHYEFEFTLDPHQFNEQCVGFEAGKFYRFNFDIGFNGKPFIKSISSVPNDQNP